MIVWATVVLGAVIVLAAVLYHRTIGRLRKDDWCLQQQIDELHSASPVTYTANPSGEATEER